MSDDLTYVPSESSKQNHKTISTLFSKTQDKITQVASDLAPQLPKAQVAFNGVTDVVSHSQGVLSTLRISTGVHRVRFSTPFKTANYLVNGSAGVQANAPADPGYYDITTVDSSGTPVDVAYVTVLFFGEQ